MESFIQRATVGLHDNATIVYSMEDTVRIATGQGILQVIDFYQSSSATSRVFGVELNATLGYTERGRIYLPTWYDDKRWNFYLRLLVKALHGWKFDPGQASFVKMLDGYGPQEDSHARLERLATMSYLPGYYVGVVARNIQWFRNDENFFEITPDFAQGRLRINIMDGKLMTMAYPYPPEDIVGYIVTCHAILAHWDDQFNQKEGKA